MLQKFSTYLLCIKGYSQRTASEYCKDLHYFARWMRSYRADAKWSNITRADIDAYIIQRVKEGCQPTTTNRELASISALYRYFIREGLLTNNPARFQSRRKVEEKTPNTIPNEDLQRAYEGTTGLVHVWIGLLATTGIRISELLSLRWEDIDFKAHSLEIIGKGRKERIVYTTAEHLELLKQAYERCPRSGRIFDYEQRTARHMLWTALKPFSRAKQLSPHAIRHSFATNLANNGVNVTTIATILGHNRIATTQKYIDMSQANTQAVTAQYSILK
jgi:Site-specific recombinase XerD